ncbi:MAG: LysM peptidoglycan-binding domain-containing protein [Spirochaetaceae bacterium]|nr:LysM peptidoglycan-binding domain-containing protein [Spirochaetaceae bacterium]
MKKRFFLTLTFLFVLLTYTFSDTIHTIQKGETIYGLSRQYGIPMNTILEYNGIKDATKIVVGQKIKIPNTTSTSSKSSTQTVQTYTVQKGDTIYGIAKKYGVSQADILNLNNLNAKSIIQVGQKLLIPNAVKGTPQATPPVEVAKQPSTTVEVPNKTTDDLRQYTEKNANTNIMWPITSKKISYLDDKTSGVVIEGSGNDTVTAIASGKVVSSGSYRGYSNVVFVKSANDYIYVYAGLKTVGVTVGETVQVGDTIGKLPEKALFTQSKLYFMVYKKNTSIDPALAPRGV